MRSDSVRVSGHRRKSIETKVVVGLRRWLAFRGARARRNAEFQPQMIEKTRNAVALRAMADILMRFTRLRSHQRHPPLMGDSIPFCHSKLSHSACQGILDNSD